MGTDDVCVIVPAFNESSVLGGVIDRLHDHFDQVICIDDGSTDGSDAIAAARGAIVLRHAINLGQGASLQTGFDYAIRRTDVNYVITFDGDGQHDPVDALRMVDVARERRLDVVLGSRTIGTVTHQPMTRQLLLRAGVCFTRASTGLRVTDTHNGLRVLSRSSLQIMRLRQRGMAHASELENAIAHHGFAWCEVPVNIAYTTHSRQKGQRNLNAVNVLCDLALNRLQASS